MKRYIDADALEKAVYRSGIDNQADILTLIEDQPTAEVEEVVWCLDCDHATIIVNSADGSKHWHCTKGYGLPEVATTDFCSRGERSKG